MRFKIRLAEPSVRHSMPTQYTVKFHRITPAEREPVSLLDDVKDFLYVDHDADDQLIYDMILAATEQCEAYTRRSLITQQWRMTCDRFPWDVYIKLRHGPIISVDSIKWFNQDNIENTFDLAKTYLTEEHLNGKIVLKRNETFPTTTLRHKDGVEIVFTAGYGLRPSDVPSQIRAGINQQVAHTYENREEGGLSPAAKELWMPYRLAE